MLHARHRLPALALAAALLAAARAQEAPPSVFSSARAAVAAGRLGKTPVQGFSIARNTFDEVNVKGGLLVGFDLGLSPWFDSEIITALRPVYRTAAGLTYGREYGKFKVPESRRRGAREKLLRVVELRAKKGYAVGGVRLRTGLGVDAMSLEYHKIAGDRLEPTPAARSAWVGNLKGGSPGERSGNGHPIVGVHGHLNDDGDKVIALGLFFARLSPAPAAPPRAEPPAAAKDAPARRAVAEAAPPKEEPAPAAKAPPEPAAQEQAEPASAEPAEEPSRSPSWLPLAIFVGVSGVILLPVALLRGKRRPDPERPAAAAKSALVAPASPAASTGICSGPASREPSSEPPPYFTVRSSFAFRANRAYRVYLLPEEIVWIDAGPALAANAAAGGAAMGGAIGGLVGAIAVHAAMRERQAREARLDGASAEDLRVLAGQGRNGRCPVDELRARVDAASWWESLSSAQGRLRLLHPRRGEFKFHFLEQEEMRKGLELLREALGARLVDNVVLDRVSWRYVRKA